MSNSIDDMVFPLKGGEVLIDHFDTPEIHPDWVRVDGPTSSHTVWTQQQGVMSASHTTTADATGAIHALMRPITDGATYPYTIEMGVQQGNVYNTAYIMWGPIFADGVTRTVGSEAYGMHYPATAGMGIQPTIHTISGYNAYGGASTGSIYTNMMYGFYHQRLIWESANNFRVQASQDGINWIGSGLRSLTMTPTHVGMAICNWNTSVTGFGSAYYFRCYESADPQYPSDTL